MIQPNVGGKRNYSIQSWAAQITLWDLKLHPGCLVVSLRLFFDLICFIETCFFCSGGAGGKGTWGKLTEVYDEDGRTHDANDPNYDSIDEDVSSKVKI